MIVPNLGLVFCSEMARQSFKQCGQIKVISKKIKSDVPKHTKLVRYRICVPESIKRLTFLGLRSGFDKLSTIIELFFLYEAF